ncbi:MAG: MerR family transcriptional regulator [Desulfobacterales bacterium]|nr:MerR family transcriptional regulator [Desulfobacterales bacterium]MCP4159665.1 MerR family transcriptional regulator [Deltaproteobacteria bacterium]
MKIRFMAGEMAKMHNVSKQTLLYYDSIGLFKPREKDDVSGYRYYSIEQCEELDVVLCLKNLGMKLQEIKSYLKRSSIEERIELLESQESLVLKKIEDINKTKNRLESIISSLKKRIKITPFKKGIKRFEKKNIIGEVVEEPYRHYEVEHAIKRLLKRARDNEYETDIHELHIYVECSDIDRDLYKKVALRVETETSEFIDAGYYAFLYHKGTFESIRNSRRVLENYIESLDYRVTGLFIEKILLDSLAVASKQDYLVEILVPVKKK